MSVVLYRFLQVSEDLHFERQIFIYAGQIFIDGRQIFDGALGVNFSSFVLGFIEDASDIRVLAGFAWISTRALPRSSGIEHVGVLCRFLTLHFFLLHDSQANETRALDGVAGPARVAELTVDGRI